VSETRTEDRLGRVEEDVREIKTTLAGLVPLINRIDERLNTGLPHPATKAELADLRTELLTALAHKPGRGYLWGVMAAMVGAQAVALAAAALVFSIEQARLQPPAPAHASIVQPDGERIAGDAKQDTGSPQPSRGFVLDHRDSLAAVPATAAGHAAAAAARVVRHHRRGGGDLPPVATRGHPSRTRAIRQAAVVGIWGPDGRIHYVSCWDIRTAGPPPYAIEPWARDPLVCPQ
jgi:hypothetical protein